MRHRLFALSLLGLTGFSATCTSGSAPTPLAVPVPQAHLPTVAAPRTPRNLTADSILATLSVRQKVGQLIFPWLLGNYTAFGSDEFGIPASWIDSLEIGGILLSVGSPLDAAAKLNALQRRSHLPLLIAADLEWGTGMRLVGGTLFPIAMAIGATGRELDAYQLGRVTAIEARAVGIHMTFSPVADVNNNPNNPIINTRSFGEDPSTVSALIAAYIRGAQDHGLFTTAKHFPGHGDTGTDSHIDLPVVPGCWARLDTLELLPFRAAIKAGVTAMMTAHVALPCIDGPGDPPPATFSRTVVTDILRDSLNFAGLAVTDALSMGAIAQRFDPGEVAVRAFLAGHDLLLDTPDPRAVLEAMVAAVDSGRLAIERLDTSVRRLLVLKEQAGLLRQRTVPLDSIPTVIGGQDFQDYADDIAGRALTLVQRGPVEEFRQTRGRQAVILYAEETNLTIGNDLLRELRLLGDTASPFRLYPASGSLSYDSARTVIADNPRAVFATSVRFIAGRGHVQMPDSLAALILEAHREKPALVISFGSPYLLLQLPDYSGGYLLAWSDVPATERAVGRALAGGTAITGRLPITLSPAYPRGFGITLPEQ